jgi:RNA polymerase sigma-70 factor (ECF subfamily)
MARVQIRKPTGLSADAARSVEGPPGVVDLPAIVADDRAFKAWYERVAPRVYAYLVSRSGSPSVAEDLLQEVFVDVVRRPETYDGRGNAVPWLIGIARHKLARSFRERHSAERWRRGGQVREIEPATEASGLEAVRLGADIGAALRSLPALHQAVLILRFMDELPVREVARHIGRSEDATESLIRRARTGFERAFERSDAT